MQPGSLRKGQQKSVQNLQADHRSKVWRPVEVQTVQTHPDIEAVLQLHPDTGDMQVLKTGCQGLFSKLLDPYTSVRYIHGLTH